MQVQIIANTRATNLVLAQSFLSLHFLTCSLNDVPTRALGNPITYCPREKNLDVLSRLTCKPCTPASSVLSPAGNSCPLPSQGAVSVPPDSVQSITKQECHIQMCSLSVLMKKNAHFVELAQQYLPKETVF